MTSVIEIIRHHIEYDAWASGRLLGAAETLTPEQLDHDFGSADKSVRGTLVHLFRSTRLWLRRIEEGAANLSWGIPEDEDWPSLRLRWEAVHKRWREWAQGLEEPDVYRVVAYSDLKGNPRAEALWQVVLHAVNHGTHHRGQVSGFLRALGKTPPPVDFIAFVRQSAK